MASIRTTGFPSPAEDEVDAPIDLSRVLDLKNPARFLVRVRGFALERRGILDDDILIVDTSLPPQSGKLVIASYMGRTILAKLICRGRKWVLASGDGSREDIAIEPDIDIEIWGVVKSVVREEA